MIFNGDVGSINQRCCHNNTATGTPTHRPIVAHEDGVKHKTDRSEDDSTSDFEPSLEESQSEGRPDTPNTSPEPSDNEETKRKTVSHDDMNDDPFATNARVAQPCRKTLENELRDAWENGHIWEGRYADLKRKLESLEQSHKKESKRLNKEIHNISAQSETEAISYLADIEKLNKTVDTLGDKLSAALEETDPLRAQCDMAVEETQEYRKRVDRKQRKLETLQHQVETLDCQVKTLGPQAMKLQQDNDSLRQEVQGLKQNEKSLRRRVDRQQVEIASLSQLLEEQERNNVSLHQQVEIPSIRHSAVGDLSHALDIRVSILQSGSTALTSDVQRPHSPPPHSEANLPSLGENDINGTTESPTDPPPRDIQTAFRHGLLPVAGHTIIPYQGLNDADDQISPTHLEGDSIQYPLAEKDHVGTPSLPEPSADSLPMNRPVEAYAERSPHTENAVTFDEAYNLVDEQATQGLLEREPVRPRPADEKGDGTPSYPEPSAPSFPSDLPIGAYPGVLVRQGRAVTSYEVPDLAEDHVSHSRLGREVIQPSPAEDDVDIMPSYPESSAALLLLAMAIGAYRGAFVHANPPVASYYDFHRTHGQVSQSHQERGSIQPSPVEEDGNDTPPCTEPSSSDVTISTDSLDEPHDAALTLATEVMIAEQENVGVQDVARDNRVAEFPDDRPPPATPLPLDGPLSAPIPPEPSTSDSTSPTDNPDEPHVEPLTPDTEDTPMNQEAIGVQGVAQEKEVAKVSDGPQTTLSPPPLGTPPSLLTPPKRSSSEDTNPTDNSDESPDDPLTPATGATATERNGAGGGDKNEGEEVAKAHGTFLPPEHPPTAGRQPSTLEPVAPPTSPSLRPPKNVRNGGRGGRNGSPDRRVRERAKKVALIQREDLLETQKGWMTGSRGRNGHCSVDLKDSRLSRKQQRMVQVIWFKWSMRKFVRSLLGPKVRMILVHLGLTESEGSGGW